MNIQSIIQQIRNVKNSSRDQGTRFEEIMRIYFSHEPEYKIQYKNVVHWSKWDKRTTGDTGIDLVAEMNDGSGFVAIQCKYYSEDNKIQKPDIDSFLAASSKKEFVRRILVVTTGLGKNAEDAVQNQHPPVHVIGLSDLEESKIDWDEYFRNNKIRLKPVKKLLPHQVEAVEKVISGFESADRGQLIMACGTGKTFTSLKIAERFAGKGGLVLFLVPSLSLMSQTLREWLAESEIPLQCYAVCSDEKVGKHDENDPTSPDDLVIPATTNGKKLAANLSVTSTSPLPNKLSVTGASSLPNNSGKLTVVFSTYQSIDAINVAQKSGVREFDLVICDEAHRTTGAQIGMDESEFVRIHDNKFIVAKKRLYMTATPRLYSAESKSRAKERDIPIWSMDDENVYGKELYYLGFSSAVNQNLLSDYKVIILGVDENVVSREFQSVISQSSNKKELPLVDPAKIVGCWNALAGRIVGDDVAEVSVNKKTEQLRLPFYCPLHRAVAFTTSINQSKQFSEQFTKIITEYHTGSPADKKALHCEVRHVDGSMNAIERNEKLNWLKSETKKDECRILTNARCLSEGVDVPALDAVMFLTPRKSQVDVVQSVGRVMRKAKGKEYGYVILPIVIPTGVDPVEALDDSETYKVVWDVLQALRAHDDRFNTAINIISLNEKRPDNIVVDFIGSPRMSGANREGNLVETVTDKINQTSQGFFRFTYAEIAKLRNAIYSKIVQKCGEKPYWEEWAKFVAEYALHYKERIGELIGQYEEYELKLKRFRTDLETDLTTEISDDEVIEMLAQHLITKPVFEALFGESPFTQNNPVSQLLNEMTDLLNDAIPKDDAAKLQRFYRMIKSKAEGVDNIRGKQKIVLELYDKFFKTAFPKMSERLGIVYTPVEVVDFIVNSVNAVLREQFNAGIGDKDIHVLDPFTGTGTFIVRLLQSGLIDKKDLLRKYQNELHANEIVLLAYYIAAINIEETFHEIYYEKQKRGNKDYVPFENILLTDTFNIPRKDQFENVATLENQKRIRRQRKTPIEVIIGNPPYSAGQNSENDNNKNQIYSDLDKRIAETYADASAATLKNSLYDSYIRAIRWASDRIEDKGVIGFVSNGSYIDGNTADGLRKCLSEEFTDIYVFNCRGNARTSGEIRRKEGGSIFGEGTRTPVAITIFVKNPAKDKNT